MTALLTAVEAARLRVGVNVIVRPGDPHPMSGHDAIGHPGPLVAPQGWVALTGPCPTCDRDAGGSHRLTDRHCPECESVFVRCVNNHALIVCGDCGYGCPDCRDGHRIVPLYRECQRDLEAHPPDQDGRCIYDCPEHDDDDCVLVGRGSIEVVPVVASDVEHEHSDFIEVWENGMCYLFPNDQCLGVLDPLPVPGRDFGIVIDYEELA